jgi:WS/DGAT/MGAT family acyltransferase
VSNRLTPLDVSFLYLEEPTTVMHVGSVMVFDAPAAGFDYDALVRHIGARIAFVPRYRQRVKQVPGRLANPLWVDDQRFDLSYHVRRSALPRPGTMAQLRDLVARVMPRHLDRSRPLWEAYVVEGLQDGRFAVVTKSHQALVDGVNAVDLAQVILDETASATQLPADTWQPSREPSLVELITGAVADAVQRPTQVLDTVRAGAGDLRVNVEKVVGTLGNLARTATSPAPDSPLNVEIGEHRRFGTVATELEVYREIRAFHATGGRRRGRGTAVQASISVNDVVLATLTGALREWMLTRGARVTPTTSLRAMVPVSVRSDDPAPGARLSRVEQLLVDLPLGEPNATVRLQQVAYQMKAHQDTGRAVPARRLAEVGGFAPSTLHSLGARVASGLSRRVFNLLVTNVPGPQNALYAAGSELQETYPVIPLARGQGLAVGLTSYKGGVFYGLNADREAMPDLEVLCQCVTESLEELRETVR